MHTNRAQARRDVGQVYER